MYSFKNIIYFQILQDEAFDVEAVVLDTAFSAGFGVEVDAVACACVSAFVPTVPREIEPFVAADACDDSPPIRLE